MGFFDFMKEARYIGALSEFKDKINKLLESSDAQTTIFTNVRRIDDVYLSSYAIEAALVDGAPVWLLSDQGKLLLYKGAANKIIPPVAGDYIFICDCAARRQDITTKHFTYRREPKTISEGEFAYFFDVEKNILVCTVNAEAVKLFKEIFNNAPT